MEMFLRHYDAVFFLFLWSKNAILFVLVFIVQRYIMTCKI
jgi:hypothetical protein